MRKSRVLSACLFLVLGCLADAGPVLQVSVNTAGMGLNGLNGSLDFMFNPSAGSQSATVQILNFSGAMYINGTQVEIGAPVAAGFRRLSPSTPRMLVTMTSRRHISETRSASGLLSVVRPLIIRVAVPPEPTYSACSCTLTRQERFQPRHRCGTGIAAMVTVNRDGTLAMKAVSSNLPSSSPSPADPTDQAVCGLNRAEPVQCKLSERLGALRRKRPGSSRACNGRRRDPPLR